MQEQIEGRGDDDGYGQWIVICANQRSGTNALANALGRTSQIESLREPFEDRVDEPRNYFGFLIKHDQFRLHLCHPTTERRSILAKAYLTYLHRSTSKPKNVMDIKYNSWHHLDPMWHFQLEDPLFMHVLKTYSSVFIHIKRRNLLAQYLSHQFADSTGVYHYLKNPTGNTGTALTTETAMQRVEGVVVNLDVQHCLSSLRMRRSTEALFTSLLSEYPYSVEINYEELFTAEAVSKPATDRLRRLIGFTEPELKTDFLRTPINVADRIVNRDEVARTLASTEFAWMVDEAFSGR